MKKIIKNFARFVRSLNKRELENLKYHLEHRTPILCGNFALHFASSDGSGWPYVLANTRRISQYNNDYWTDKWNESKRDFDTLWDKIFMDEEDNYETGIECYVVTLKNMTQSDVRKAIKLGLE